MLVIRRAERADAETVLMLIRALAEFEQLDPPDDEAAGRFVEHGWGAQPKFEAWLGEIEGEAVAYMVLFETYSTFLGRPTLYVEDIFVLPQYRKRGVGRALFEHAMKLARERGCGRMEWCCLDWNTPAQRFYESLGARRLNEWYYYRLTRDQLAGHGTGELDIA